MSDKMIHGITADVYAILGLCLFAGNHWICATAAFILGLMPACNYYKHCEREHRAATQGKH